MPASLAPVPEEPEPGDRTIEAAFRDISDGEFFEQLGGGRGQDGSFDPVAEWPRIPCEEEEGKEEDLILEALKAYLYRSANKMPSPDWLNLD